MSLEFLEKPGDAKVKTPVSGPIATKYFTLVWL